MQLALTHWLGGGPEEGDSNWGDCFMNLDV